MTTKAEGGKIEFVDYHLPDLADGDYTLTVKQSIKTENQTDDKQNFSEDLPEATLRFSVLGPRFTLDPQVVTSVFPPPGSVGDHSDVLPHIILNRSTLPWERLAIATKKDEKKIPWLALLLFEEGEFTSPLVSLVTLQGHDSPVNDAQFSPDGKRIITASHDKTVRLWNVESGGLLGTLQGPEGGVTSAQFSPDGKRIVTTSHDKTVRLWNAESGELLATLRGHDSPVNDVQFSPDGKHIVTVSDEKTARLWETESGGLLATLQGHQGAITSAQFSPDGKCILTASDDKTARLWKAESGGLLATLQGHEGGVTSAQFSPDGKCILTASDDKTARLWKAESGGLLATLEGHEGRVTSAQFSPDGKRTVTASDDKTARLWKAESGGLLATLEGHEGRVTSAQFSPDGKRILTSSHDKTARLWEAESGRLLATLQGNAQFSPDGKRIVTASDDKTARLWEAESGRLLAILQGHNGAVASAQFSPDGMRIVTASDDKTARLWETHPLQVSDLRDPKTGEIKWPGISVESGQHDSDCLSVIDVPWSLLKQIIPTGDDLRFLSHVRKTQESTGKPGEDELAVILGGRLPKPGGVSWVHLLSVEGRYKQAGDQVVFDDRGAQDGDLIRLVSLKSWRFTCADPKSNFTGLLTKLDHKDLLRLPRLPTAASVVAAASVVTANRYLAMGCVPLPHTMRQGNKTVSWYRGPLVPGNNTTERFKLPIRSADELVYYDDTYGMFDVSYAAAWELGRLLALQSKSFAINLYRWKRDHARKGKDEKLQEAEIQLADLPFYGPTADLELPETVTSWFENLILLEGVPFNYLVPDERMLPFESIRFFQIDPIWMECLVDGAFSIGRVLRSDKDHDQSHKENQLGALSPKKKKASGFLIRSDVVAGWPGLQVDGYDESIEELLKAKVLKHGEDSVPEKEENELFEINPADGVSDLNLKTKLEEKFQLSKGKCTLEHQQWFISSAQQAFTLIKRENNQIDVCAFVDSKYLFSIDGGFETDLDAGDLSGALRGAFAEQKQALSQDSHISVIRWFMTDDEHQKHYLIQKEQQRIKVYRAYKLPLLRMARLSANVLICLFEGIVQTVDLHLKPDTLHCGVDKPKGDHKGLYKEVKGGKLIDPLPWREEAKRTININELASKFAKDISPAKFALEMFEGAEKVRFYFKPTAG